MEVGRQKVAEAGLSDHITFEYQDCTALTYPDNSFDAVTAAFGVRNFENIEQGITEMYRVLKPGGPSDDPGTVLTGTFPDEATLQHLFESRDPYRRAPAIKRAYSLQLPAGLHQSRSTREGHDRPAQPGRFQRSPFAHFHLRHLFAIHGQQGRFANHHNSINHLKFTGHAKIWFNRISPSDTLFQRTTSTRSSNPRTLMQLI